MQRLIVQMAQAVEQQGQDTERAAVRAAKRALNQANIAAPDLLGLSDDDLFVRIRVGVPDPSAVDAGRIAAWNKRGQTEVDLVEGGLLVKDPETGVTQIVASAAVEVFLPPQSEWRLR